MPLCVSHSGLPERKTFSQALLHGQLQGSAHRACTPGVRSVRGSLASKATKEKTLGRSAAAQPSRQRCSGMLGPGLVGSAAVGSACLAAAALARLRSARPQLFHGDSPFHAAVLARCPTLKSVYRLMPFVSSNGYVIAPPERQAR